MKFEVFHAAYFTRGSWKYFLTRSGDCSSISMCAVATAFNFGLVRVGTSDSIACFRSAFSDPSLDRFAVMHSQVVQNQEHFLACVLDQGFQKLNQLVRIECLVNDHPARSHFPVNLAAFALGPRLNFWILLIQPRLYGFGAFIADDLLDRPLLAARENVGGREIHRACRRDGRNALRPPVNPSPLTAIPDRHRAAQTTSSTWGWAEIAA